LGELTSEKERDYGVHIIAVFESKHKEALLMVKKREVTTSRVIASLKASESSAATIRTNQTMRSSCHNLADAAQATYKYQVTRIFAHHEHLSVAKMSFS